MIYCGKSDIGKKRSSNQDSFSVSPVPGGVLCTVCDGMGGANGGNIASSVAVSTYSEYVLATLDNGGSRTDVRDMLTVGVTMANSAVFAKSAIDMSLRGMGTTLVSALVIGNKAYAVNVGDSRLYRVSLGVPERISHDHSYVQYLIDIGKIRPEDAKDAPMKNIITRSIGNEERAAPDFFEFEVREGDYLLLCSDGLTNFVGEDEIAAIIDPPGDGDPSNLQKKVDDLIDTANANGGGDNITAIVVKI